MPNYEAGVGLVAEYLSSHRHIPPERDGWFSMSELQQGIRNELGVRVRSAHVTKGTDTLLEVVPPAIEDAWFRCDENKDPILDESFIHPDIPNKARRFYRALGGAAQYAAAEIVHVNIGQPRLAGT